ncbi:MAG: phosphatidate cytidylyltransferase [Formosimonas sp.]
MVKTRVITALLMLAVVAGLVFWAPFSVWLVAVSALVAWSGAEWARLAGFSKGATAAYAFVLPAALGGAYAWSHMNGFFPTLVVYAALLSLVFWLLLAPLWLYFGWHVRDKPLLGFLGAVLLLTAGLCLLLIRPVAAQAWLLLGLLMVVWVADSVAFFAGRAFGRHKLAPSISPGKTIEGAAGAWLGVTAYLLIVVVWQGWLPIDEPVWKWVLLAFMLTYVSILGDLFESWLKRCAGVKDSGNALPGHGGILDRIDAILPTLPLQVVLLTWILR